MPTAGATIGLSAAAVPSATSGRSGMATGAAFGSFTGNRSVLAISVTFSSGCCVGCFAGTMSMPVSFAWTFAAPNARLSLSFLSGLSRTTQSASKSRSRQWSERLTEKAGLLRTNAASRSRNPPPAPAASAAAATAAGSNTRGRPTPDLSGPAFSPSAAKRPANGSWPPTSLAQGTPPTSAFDPDAPAGPSGHCGEDSLESCCFMGRNLPARSIHLHLGFISWCRTAIIPIQPSEKHPETER